MNDKDIENEIQAKGLTAPRVTPQHIEDVVVGEVYIVPNDSNIIERLATGNFDPVKIKRTTICILTLRNGFTVTGINNGPVSAANFDAELGRKLARQKAVNEIWALEGYLLKQQQYVDSHFPAVK
jgi:hypothetical protein